MKQSRKQIIRLEASPTVGVYANSWLYDLNDPVKVLLAEKIDKIRRIMDSVFGGLTNQRHPCPGDDSMLKQNLCDASLDAWDVFYGFKDEDQLRRWFHNNELLEDLDHEGVTIACYSVSTTYEGFTQSCAPLDEKKIENVVWRIKPTEFLEKGLPNS